MIKSYKKFDQKQLENNPLLWSTRFYPLLLAGIGMWLISFILGYVTFTSKSLLDHDYHDHFFRSFYNWFFIIAVIVIITFWAIQFYKHNAFSRFYPLKPYHFQKKFILIFFPFLLILTGYYPFTYGSKLKVRYLINEEQLVQDFIDLNRISAFIPLNEDDYSIQNRLYPAPFPCRISYKYKMNDNTWTNQSIYEAMEVSEDGTIKQIQKVKWDEKQFEPLENYRYIFFKSTYKPFDGDSCNMKEFLTKVYAVDSSTYQLSRNGVLNYGNLLVGNFDNYTFDTSSPTYFSETSNLSTRLSFSASVYQKKYAKETHDLVLNKDFKKLDQMLTQARVILNKYHIDHELDNKKIIRYLKDKKFNNIKKIIDRYDLYEDLEEVLDERDYSLEEYNSFPFTRQQEIYSGMYIQYRELTILRNNFYKSSNYSGFAKFSSGFLYFAFALSFLFFLLSTVKLKSFFLSIPVWGVLLIIVGVTIGNTLAIRNSTTLIPGIFLFMLLVVMALNWWFLRDAKISLKPLHVSITMALVSAPVIPVLILFLIHNSSRTVVPSECNNSYDIGYYGSDYSYMLDGFLINDYFIFTVAFIAGLLSFYMLRIYRSKPE